MKNKANWKPDTMCNSGGKYKVRVNGRHTPAYGAWMNMMSRCYNKGHKSFEWYGGNGVTVDLVWHDYQDFAEWCEITTAASWSFSNAVSGLYLHGQRIAYYFFPARF